MTGAQPDIKGWCPGAHRPMMSGDGLVARVRPWLGQVSRAQALGLADLAARLGSGVIDLTSRANLQIRGIDEGAYGDLLAGLSTLDLLDADPEHEHHRNIVLDPYRSAADRFDQEAIAAALTAGLLRPFFADLPSKFGFVVDAGARRQLGGVSGDIRIEQTSAGLLVRCDGAARGRVAEDEAEAARFALDLARWFLGSGGVSADGRGRMRRHLESGAQLPDTLDGTGAPLPLAEPPVPVSGPVPGPRDGGTGVGFAFGQVTSAGLRALCAGLAPETSLRITPYRMVFLPGVDPRDVPAHPDLIITADAPLLRILACPGAPYCPQAAMPTRQLGRALAAAVPRGESCISLAASRAARRHVRRSSRWWGGTALLILFETARHGMSRATPG
ncbi:precorrin-3B synthase [Roseobacteraceae bacterium S113]